MNTKLHTTNKAHKELSLEKKLILSIGVALLILGAITGLEALLIPELGINLNF